MATKIRLKRCGGKKQPHYRLVVMDSRIPRNGRAIEEIGYYNPLPDPPEVTIQEDRVLHWLMCGAQPSDTVRSLLRRQGILQRLHEARESAAGNASAQGDQ